MSERKSRGTPGGVSKATSSTRRQIHRTGSGFDRRSGFELGARVLQINVDALVTLYDKTITIIERMIQAGRANGMVGYFGVLNYMDLLHGGAYACAVEERPWHIGTIQGGNWVPTSSRYDPGAVELPSAGITDWLLGLFTGSATSPTDLYDEVIINGNCPHIFPRILSDEAYAIGRLGLAYATGTELFKQGATGLSTLVDAETKFVRENVAAAKEAVGVAGDIAATIPKGVAALQSLLPLLAVV